MIFVSLFWFLSCIEQEKPKDPPAISTEVTPELRFNADDWRVQTLLEDNRYYLSQDQNQVREKFKKMASSEYAFMRGSFSLYLQHLGDETNSALKTRFLQEPNARRVPIFGDAHPENITIYLDPKHIDKDENVSIEFSDLDSADYGPWIVDLRRSAMAFRLFYASIAGCGCDENKSTKCDQALEVFWQGYQDGLMSKQNETKMFWKDSNIIEKRIERARNEKKNEKKRGKLISENQKIKNSKTIKKVSKSGNEQAGFIINQVLSDEEDLLDMAQIYGKGVSSLPATRYLFLWKTPLVSRLQLGEAREVFPPPKYPWSIEEEENEKYSIGRMNGLRSFLWSKENVDPNYQLIAYQDEGKTRIFKFQSKSEYFKDIDLDKLQEWFEDEEIDEGDVVQLGKVVGYVLGQAHGREHSQIDFEQTPRMIIEEDIKKSGGFSAVWEEIEKTSCLELAIVSEDYQWFSKNWENILEAGK